jgi:ketosteroid isomerase-like protein
MRKLVIAICLCLALPLLAQDPAKVGSEIYKCTFENEYARLCEVVFKPGASVAVHSHPNHLVYVTAPGRLRITPVGKPAAEMDFKPGMAAWIGAEAHSAVNTGKTELRGVVIEFKEKPMQDPATQAILDLEKEWMEAMIAGDTARIESITAEEWMFTDPTGRVQTRAESVAEFRNGTLKIESTTPLGLKVNVHGDTAIVNGRTRDKGTYNGADISGEYQFTDVFVRRDGKWRAVATQVTRVVPAQ